MKGLTNRVTIFLIVSVLLIAGFLVTNFISYHSAKMSLRENIINTSLPLTRDNIYSEIQRDIMIPVYVASMMANDTFLRDWIISGEKDISTIQKYLNELKNKYKLFTTFLVSEKTKHYYHYTGRLKTISMTDEHDSWYSKFLVKHIPYELVVDTNEAANYALTIFINHRVYDYEKNLIGVTGVGLDIERVSNLLATYRVKYNRNIYLVDQNGIIKAHHDKSLLDISNIKLMSGIDEISDKILSVTQNSENLEYDKNGERILLTKRFIPELNWFLIVEQNQNIAMKEIWLNFIKSSILGLIVSSIVIIIVMSVINYYNKKLEKLATTDELTGTYNRREFVKYYDRAVSAYKRNGQIFSIILVDVDKFKNINDTLGHHEGDKIIKAVTRICQTCIRGNDLVARWGGDEFILLINGNADAAKTIAVRIADNIANDSETNNLSPKLPSVTISAGITEYAIHDTEESITIRADKALYYAKENGRNRIEILNATSPQG